MPKYVHEVGQIHPVIEDEKGLFIYTSYHAKLVEIGRHGHNVIYLADDGKIFMGEAE